MTNEDNDFYAIMGPYLSSREIVKEIGAPVWDDSDKVWFIAIRDNRTVLGFAAITVVAGWANFCSAWVDPIFRGKGIYDALMSERIAYADANHLPSKTAARRVALHTCQRYGFVPARRPPTKNYTFLERTAR